MSDNNETPEVEPTEAVDFSTLSDDVLEAKQLLAEARVTELKAQTSKTAVDAAEFQKLRADIREIKAARAAISAMEIDLEEPAPVEAPAPVAEVAEIVPAVEAPVVEEVAEDPVLVAAELDASKLDGTGAVTAVAAEETAKTGPAIFASLDGSAFVSRDGNVQEATTLDAVASKVKGLVSTLRTGSGIPNGNFHVMRTDSGAGKTLRARGGDSPEAIAFNTALINGKLSEANAAVMADCRNPIELEIQDSCSYRTDTQFWDIFNRQVDANACSYKWKRSYNLEDIEGGVTIWDACQQGLIDPNDVSTWKPIAELPPCDEDCYSTAEAFYLTRGLRVTVDDQFCRPERIAEANDILAALRAIELDTIARSFFDAHAADGGNVKLGDLSIYGGVGLRPALQIEIAKLTMEMQQRGRYTCDESGRFAEVPEYLVKKLAIDMSLAGEQASQARTALVDIFASCGISNVLFSDDYGCEGNLAGGVENEPGDKAACIDWNCEDNPFDSIEGKCPAFGSGTPSAPLPTQARIRIGHADAFIKGSTDVVDYDLRQDNSNLRKNEALYFGESRHFLFPRGDLESGVLDLDNVCANGQRVDHTAVIPCPIP